ncbi:MAG: methyltransferase domain-containing protein [Oligoflexus sp.]
MAFELIATNPKQTTQNAPLETLLTYLRVKKIVPFVKNRVVLDFGCGEHLKASRAIQKIADKTLGYDLLFKDLPTQRVEQIDVYGSLDDIKLRVDTIVSLACFEHIEPIELPLILEKLHRITSDNGQIVGTVPTPSSKPVLEFLSYKLGLIDSSQIRDHKVYYDKKHLQSVCEKGGWQMKHYSKFQFGFNSFFILGKS